MKINIPLWFIVTVLAFAAFVWYRSQKPEPPAPINPMNGYYDSMSVIADRLQRSNDSLTLVTQKRDTFIDKQIIYVKEKATSAYSLGADSSLRLFLQWTRQFGDSSFRERYFRLGSDSIN